LGNGSRDEIEEAGRHGSTSGAIRKGRVVGILEAITFDYWQTLLIDTPEGLQRAREIRVEGIREALASLGIFRDTEAIHQAYDESGQRLMRIWAQDLDIGPREQLWIFLESLGLHPSNGLRGQGLEDLEHAYSRPLLEALPGLCPGAKEILQGVKESGYRIGLISNTGRTPGFILKEVLRHFEILHFFDFLSFSDELRVRKPNPKIFLQNLEELGVRPDMALHVGDDLRCDVGGAKGVGMKAIHLDRGEEKRADIQPDGIIEDLCQLEGILQRLRRFG